jgi:hypothetical protein
MAKNWRKKITAEKNLIYFWSKIAIYLSLGLLKGRPSYRSSLQPSKENIQHLKTLNFSTFFHFCGLLLPFWIRIWIHWPDWIRINPDPKHCRPPCYGSFFRCSVIDRHLFMLIRIRIPVRLSIWMPLQIRIRIPHQVFTMLKNKIKMTLIQ